MWIRSNITLLFVAWSLVRANANSPDYNSLMMQVACQSRGKLGSEAKTFDLFQFTKKRKRPKGKTLRTLSWTSQQLEWADANYCDFRENFYCSWHANFSATRMKYRNIIYLNHLCVFQAYEATRPITINVANCVM